MMDFTDQFTAPPPRKKVKVEHTRTISFPHFGVNSRLVETVQQAIHILRSNQVDDLPGLSKADYTALKDACSSKIDALKKRNPSGAACFRSSLPFGGLFRGESIRIPVLNTLPSDVIDNVETKKKPIYCRHCKSVFWAKPTQKKKFFVVNHSCSGTGRLQYTISGKRKHRRCTFDHEPPCLVWDSFSNRPQLKMKTKNPPRRNLYPSYTPLRIKEETDPLSRMPPYIPPQSFPPQSFPPLVKTLPMPTALSNETDQFQADVVSTPPNFFSATFPNMLPHLPMLQDGSDHEQFVSGDTPLTDPSTLTDPSSTVHSPQIDYNSGSPLHTF
jgi:hypothetical protein